MIKKTRTHDAWIGLGRILRARTRSAATDSPDGSTYAVTSCDGCGKRLARGEFVCRVVFTLVDTPHRVNCAICESCYSTMDQDRMLPQRLFSVGLGSLVAIAPERDGDED